MADKGELERALGPVSPRVDRERVYAGVQARLRKDRMMRPVRRILAVGAVVVVAAVAMSRTPETRAPRREPAVATRTPERPVAAPSDWLAVSQSPGTRMTTRPTEDGLRIDLAAGGVALEVRPGSGHTLRIDTPNAEVEVVGTTVAVLVRGDATDVLVGAGRVLASTRGGAVRALAAGESATIESSLGVLADAGPAETLLGTLPGRWHPRHAAPTAEAPAAPASSTATSTAAPHFAPRDCDAAAEAASVADDARAPLAARRSALELLTTCGDAAARMRRLEELVALVPRHPVAWLDLGKKRENAGDRTGAALAYRHHLEVAGRGPLGDEAALALCRVSLNTRSCLEQFLRDRPSSDRREEAEEQLRAMQR